jgi:hypothetical protein
VLSRTDLAAGGGGGGRSGGQSQEDGLLLLVLVHRQELLLKKRYIQSPNFQTFNFLGAQKSIPRNQFRQPM